MEKSKKSLLISIFILVSLVAVGAAYSFFVEKTIDLPDLFQTLSQEDQEKQLTALRKMPEDTRREYLEITDREPAITADVMQITHMMGGENIGLEYRVKSPSSTYEKMYEREKKVDIHEMNDIIRYTEIFPADKLAQGTADSVKAYEELGYTVMKIKNTFIDENSTYKGINTVLSTADGQLFEIQFHTPKSHEFKESIHKLYEEYRVLSPEDPKAIRLEDEMRQMNQGIGEIKDIANIKNYTNEE